MKSIGGWVVVGLGVLLLAAGLGDDAFTPWKLVPGGALALVGLVMALRSDLVVIARRVGYAIRTVRSAAKGEPEPPPPAPDLMATLRVPMKAVPRPEKDAAPLTNPEE